MNSRLGITAAMVALVALAAAPIAAAKKVGDGRGGVELKRIGSFDLPVHVENAPGFKRLLFVVEQDGRIKVLRKVDDGRWRKRGTFLDIRDTVVSPADGGGFEQGLLSVAFPPDYRTSRRFYVYLTGNGGDIVIREYRRSSSKRADVSTTRDVVTVPHPTHVNHNGGQLQFGPDGLLYAATGDGGGEPNGRAQDPHSLLGKLLRIDPLPGNSGEYRIPAQNPLIGSAGRDEIYSSGLRNPWRFSFDRRSGRISIADVGQSTREEINYETLDGARGANFGWDAFEGSLPVPGGSSPPAEHELPIHQYGHGGGRCAITGGYVVRNRALDSLYGRYLYADFCTGELRSLIPRLDGARRDRGLGIARPGISTFGEGRKGRIFVASRYSGKLWQVRPR